MAATCQIDVLEKRIESLEALVFGNADKDALYPKVYNDVIYICVLYVIIQFSACWVMSQSVMQLAAILVKDLDLGLHDPFIHDTW